MAGSTVGGTDEISKTSWQRWRPLPYLLVSILNATAAVLLYPASVELSAADDVNSASCDDFTRFSFCMLMSASFWAGCVAASLTTKVQASAHAKSACGCAMAIWFHSMLASMSMRSPSCRYGLAPAHWYETFAVCRLVSKTIGLLWIQMLIASQLNLLEQSSNRQYRARCFHKFVMVQIAASASTALLMLVGRIVPGLWPTAMLLIVLIAVLAALCNLAASRVAIGSLAKTFFQLQRTLHAAELNDTPVPVRSSLRLARRFAALQVMGVAFSFLLTLLPVIGLVICCLFFDPFDSPGFDVDDYHAIRAIASMDPYVIVFWRESGLKVREGDTGNPLAWFTVFFQAFVVVGNAAVVLLLSGGNRLPQVNKQPCQCCGWTCCCVRLRQSRAVPAKEPDWSPLWKEKVEELALRGITLRSDLLFCQRELFSMPGWQYVPCEHKTRDVVRRAIIPLTSKEESSYAVSMFNREGSRRPQVMVTHNWGNCFKDLLAAVISDALQECSFSLAARLLEDDFDFLCQLLAKSGRLGDTYWICAFAVNQHACICHSNPYDRDPITNELHPVCNCSSVNIIDPDGRSTSSEINKFDDMMYHLAGAGGCRQVIAVDESLDLFRRAWCVAEIAEAKRLHMNQALKLASRATIMQRARTLENLDVRSMSASSEADKELILNKIHQSRNIEQFNAELQSLIFDPKAGLLESWNAMDSLQQTGEVGRLIRWGQADAGTGKVWKAWEAHG
ncbi:BMY1 [Symbiodinium natans]|uniref:BMY1 protein n=1 Tax=Symbiodinium natans TaxID=878477 RepID=A0A812TWE0_9DINO|nr:BMY1 [Symbiodinium natans]